MPATTRAAMSITSSTGRRPFGNPATSPARNPKRFCCSTGVGGMPVFNRRRSAIGPASFGPHPGQIGVVYCTRELAEALSLSTLQERGAALFTIGISASTVRLTHRHPRRIVFLLQFLQTLFLAFQTNRRIRMLGRIRTL